MEKIINITSTEFIYYILGFFYITTDFILSVVHLDINKLGQRRQTAKVIILFLVVLILANIFFSKITIYFLIPIVFSGVLFLLVDKKTHFEGGKFSYFADEVWKNILTFCKNWFGYGLLGSLVGLLIAIIQVQVFQGGSGGLFALKDICIQYSADGSACLLNGSSTQIVGDRLGLVILIYSGQAFVWAGLIFALLKDKGKILTSLGLADLMGKNKWAQKIEDFRKTHYI